MFCNFEHRNRKLHNTRQRFCCIVCKISKLTMFNWTKVKFTWAKQLCIHRIFVIVLCSYIRTFVHSYILYTPYTYTQLTVSIQQTIIYEIFIFMRFLLKFMILSGISVENCVTAKFHKHILLLYGILVFPPTKIIALKMAYNQRTACLFLYVVCVSVSSLSSGSGSVYVCIPRNAQYIGANMFMQMHFNRKTYLNRTHKLLKRLLHTLLFQFVCSFFLSFFIGHGLVIRAYIYLYMHVICIQSIMLWVFGWLQTGEKFNPNFVFMRISNLFKWHSLLSL